MASAATWTTFLIEAGIEKDLAVAYSSLFQKNRIERSMLSELNVNYLNAMSIDAVGDQIKILSHSKKVIAKDEQAIYLSAVKVVENKSGEKSKNQQIQKSISPPAPRKVRRVHPEHEGKYTVTLPKGTTPKTRAILIAKMNHEKKSIFDRLASATSKVVSDVEISSSSDSFLPKTTSSIFNRLGNYNPAGDFDKKSIAFSGILKSLPPSSSSKSKGIVKTTPRNPLRTPTRKMIPREKPSPKFVAEDVSMESEKQVTFSPEVTLRVYEHESTQNINSRTRRDVPNVKSRLGANLHTVKKAPMKPAKVSSPPSLSSKMKSDMKSESIHSRLTLYNSKTKSVFKRLGE